MKTIKGFMPIALALIFLLTLSCCGRVQARKMKISHEEVSATTAVGDEALFYGTRDKSAMTKIASSGMLEMYLEEKTMSVCIYDAAANKYYHALPCEKGNETPSSLNVRVYSKGKEYVLSSQKDSLAFDCTKYKKTKHGVVITYSFRQSTQKGEKLDISIPVTYILSDGRLTVSVNCNKISAESDTIIRQIELLPFFAGDTASAKGDYIVLPDGCGELMHLGVNSNVNERSLRVYGNDDSHEENTGDKALIAYFGRKCGDSAIVCVATEGESLCSINAKKATDAFGYNRAWASFEITAAKEKDNSLYVSDTAYKGNITLSYRFLSGENSDYVAMAGAVRELLIREGCLRENAIEGESEYPFNLTLILSQEDSSAPLSDFNKASELLSYLKSKGFSHINVILQGIYDSGTVKIKKELGNEKDLDSLMQLQNEGNVLFYSDYSLYGGKGSAKTIKGDKLVFSSLDKVTGSLNDLLKDIRKQSFYGIYINDAGQSLYSDYGSKTYSVRENVKNALNKIFGSIFASRQLMISRGNLYSVKYACGIINLPSSSSMGNAEGFETVPFSQTILHGLVDYSHEAINLSSDSKAQMLKAVEYGANLHYTWHCTDDLNGTDDSTYYMTGVSESKTYYDKMKSDLSNLRGRRITSHEKVAEQVYLTRFGEDAGVYVNYSQKAVSVDGITVDAKSYALVS